MCPHKMDSRCGFCPALLTSSKHAVPRDQCKWVRLCPRNGIFMKYAILIDAGFLKRKLGSQTEPLNVNGVCTFLDALRAHEVLAGMSLHRVYCYDAPPLDIRVTKPLLGGKINFGVTSLARTNAWRLPEFDRTDPGGVITPWFPRPFLLSRGLSPVILSEESRRILQRRWTRSWVFARALNAADKLIAVKCGVSRRDRCS